MVICDAKIIDGKICGVEKSVKEQTFVSENEFIALTEELKDYLIYVEGSEYSSYDNSDDDRADCYSSKYPFGRYYEIAPSENSKYLLRIDGKIRGVVFFVGKGYNDVYYEPFLFDDSIKNSIRLGYSASHSSNYTYIEKVSLVKRGSNGAPEKANKISFRLHETSTFN